MPIRPPLLFPSSPAFAGNSSKCISPTIRLQTRCIPRILDPPIFEVSTPSGYASAPLPIGPLHRVRMQEEPCTIRTKLISIAPFDTFRSPQAQSGARGPPKSLILLD